MAQNNWRKIREGKVMIFFEKSNGDVLRLQKIYVGTKQKWSMSVPNSQKLIIINTKTQAIARARAFMSSH